VLILHGFLLIEIPKYSLFGQLKRSFM